MVRIERVLCPVDQSPVARLALAHAVNLAHWYGARVQAIEVLPTGIPPLMEVPVPAVPTLSEEAQRGVAEALDAFVAPYTGLGVEIDTAVVEGDVVGGILEAAAAWPADLLVIGTHGRGGLQHLTLGSVAEKVMRRAACPVLTVPPGARAVATRHTTHTVLCATDFSPASLLAVERAFSVAQEADASLVLVHVLDWPAEWTDTMPLLREDWESRAQQRLVELIPEGAEDWCHVTTVVAAGRAAAEILREAEARGADLIIMGVHGRAAIEHLLFGSTTYRVVREAKCPVMTVRK
ncbi:MAG: universal stress protein [Vicinamibacterales bacterium]